MKSGSLYISLIIGLICCPIALALENPSVGSPVGSGTVPPTAYKPGLVPSKNPIDTSTNLIVTGNVTNGMQFRGIVPYNSPTNFSQPAGNVSHTSGSLDSFLSNSAGSQNFSTSSSGGLTPYYSPTLSVTKIQPGTRGDYTPSSPDLTGTNYNPGVPQSAGQPVYNQSYITQISRRPFAMSQEELEKLVESDVTKYPMGGDAATQAQQQFWNSLGVRVERRAEQPKPEPLTGKETNLDKLLGVNAQKPSEVQGEEQTNLERTGWQKTNQEKQFRAADVYDQMRKQLVKPPELTVSKPMEELQMKGEANKTLTLPKTEANEPKMSKQGVTPGEFAKAYKSFVARSNDKFNQHMKAAEDFMKQGRFYRAADAYTLASIYKPDDPLGYAGKSLALFGSGEYLSSSLFLARAIEIFPEYAKVKVDIVAIMGDKDTVENRILEAREWLDKSDNSELAFLLSYIYYQMGRLEFAKQSIDKAAAKMPNSPAVATLKKAIEERLAKP